jgi:archaellum component FlaC
MSEEVVPNQSKAGGRWLLLTSRIVVAIVMSIAVLGLILNLAGIAGVWVVRAYGCTAVTGVAGDTMRALQTVDNGLGRVNMSVQDGRQILTQMNDEVTKLGNQIQANSPVISRINQLVNNDLAPKIENARTTATTVHDAIIKVNSTLVVLNRLSGVSVPSLNNRLGSLSERTQDAKTAVQDLRATVADVKAGIVTKAQAAIMNLTSKIDGILAGVQQTISKYQATVTRTQDRIESTSNTILFLLDLSTILLTLFLLISAAGQALLFYICWRFVRTGHFPSLRVTLT